MSMGTDAYGMDSRALLYPNMDGYTTDQYYFPPWGDSGIDYESDKVTSAEVDYGLLGLDPAMMYYPAIDVFLSPWHEASIKQCCKGRCKDIERHAHIDDKSEIQERSTTGVNGENIPELATIPEYSSITPAAGFMLNSPEFYPMYSSYPVYSSVRTMIPPVTPTDAVSVTDVSESHSDKASSDVSALIKEHGKRGNIGYCWSIWQRLVSASMHGVGVSPNEITLGCMVDALVSNGAVHLAESLVMQWKTKIRPNTVVYSTLIHGWAKLNDAKRAMLIFSMMKKENVPCNAVTYNCMIHACVRVSDIDGALELLEAMKSTCRGSNVRPDKYTYSTIIKGYCAKGDMDNALLLFDSMLKESLSPDLVIYNTLLDGCVKRKFHDTCDRLLHDMTEYWNIAPNSYTLSILIKRYGRQGDLKQAFKLVDELPSKYAFRPNAHVWTCLISACIAHGRLDAAEAVFESMCGRTPMESSLEGLFERSLDIGCQPDAKTYETLIQGFIRYNHAAKAVKLASEGLRLNGSCLSQQCVDMVLDCAFTNAVDETELVSVGKRLGYIRFA